MKSITLLTEWRELFAMLEPADCGRLMGKMFEYAKDEQDQDISDLSEAGKMLYKVVISKLNNDENKRACGRQKGLETIAENRRKKSANTCQGEQEKTRKNKKKNNEKNNESSCVGQGSITATDTEGYDDGDSDLDTSNQNHFHLHCKMKKKSEEKENTHTTSIIFDKVQLRGNLLGCLSQVRTVKEKEALMVQAGKCLLEDFPTEEPEIVSFVQWWGQQGAIPGKLMCECENGFNTLLRYKQWRKKKIG